MSFKTETIPVQLDNGIVVKIATSITDELEKIDGADSDEYEDEDISFGYPSFKSVKETIVGLSNEIVETFKKVKPSKAAVEFGLELTSDKQSLWATIVPISSKVHLKVTLEWPSQETENPILNPPTVKGS